MSNDYEKACSELIETYDANILKNIQVRYKRSLKVYVKDMKQVR